MPIPPHNPIPFARDHGSPGIVWRPGSEYVERSRLRRFMERHGIGSFEELLRRSTQEIEWYWDAVVRDLGLEWYEPYDRVLDLSHGIEWPRWFPGGRYNYVHDAVDKQARGPRSQAAAIVWEGEDGEARTLTYAELHTQVNRAAHALKALGVGVGDRVGVFMPMLPDTAVAVLAGSKLRALYL